MAASNNMHKTALGKNDQQKTNRHFPCSSILYHCHLSSCSC